MAALPWRWLSLPPHRLLRPRQILGGGDLALEQFRRQIWQRLLPDKAPLDVQFEELQYLAESFELAGGSIKNVIIRAAYAAAEAGATINIDRLEAAAFQEYRELGKLVRS